MTSNKAAEAALPAERIGRALLWMLCGSFLAAVLWGIPKLAGATLPPVEITFMRYVSAFVLIVPMFAYSTQFTVESAERSQAHSDMRPPVWIYLLRALMAVSRLTLAIAAVQLMKLANAQAIYMTNGVFTVFFAALILGERIGLRAAVPAVVSIVGGIIAARPDLADGTSWSLLGSVFAFSSALVFGLESVLIRYTAQRDRPLRILFWGNALGLGLLMPATMYLWMPVTGADLVLLLAMGPIALGVQYFHILAYRFARASILVPMRYTIIIFSLLFGLVFLGEWPSLQALFGMALIAAGGTALAWLNRPPRPAAGTATAGA